MTTYIVLQKREAATTGGRGEAYTVLGSASASGPEQALRKVADPTRSGSFAVVPLRNWSIIEAQIEQPAPKMTLREIEFVPGQMVVDEILDEENENEMTQEARKVAATHGP